MQNNLKPQVNPTRSKNKKRTNTNFRANVSLGKSTVKYLIDSGSSEHIIDAPTFIKVLKQNPEIQLRKSKKRLFAFGSSTPLPVMGEFDTALESPTKITPGTIVVMKNATGCLLSGKTSVELDYLHFAVNNVNEQSKEQSRNQSSLKSNTHSTSLENEFGNTDTFATSYSRV